MWPPRKIPGAAFSVRKMLRYIDSAAMGNCFQAISQLHTEGFLTPTALWAAGVRNGNLPRPKEALNQSPSAEQRIFFPAHAASKAGNTYSIPPLLNPSSREKSLAVGSRRFNQSFLKSHSPNSRVFCRHEMGLYTRHGCILLSKSHASKIGSTVACGMLPLCPDQKYGTGNFPNR